MHVIKYAAFILAVSRKDMRNPATVIKNLMRHTCDGEAGSLGETFGKYVRLRGHV